jgi:hypothetical protein
MHGGKIYSMWIFGDWSIAGWEMPYPVNIQQPAHARASPQQTRLRIDIVYRGLSWMVEDEKKKSNSLDHFNRSYHSGHSGVIFHHDP